MIMKIQSVNKDLRNFGVMMGIVCIFVGLYRWYYEYYGYLIWFILAIALFFCGILFPKLMFYPYKYWMKLASILEFIITRVFLGIIFFLLITPISFILKIFKIKTLNTQIDKNINSYYTSKSTQLSKYFDRLF